MRKLLEINFENELNKNMITVYACVFLVFLVFLVTRVVEQSIFNLGFLLEFLFVFGSVRFYMISIRNRNYAFWGMTMVLALYLLMEILHYTFFSYDILVLYLSILSGIFLAINAFILSSPLYFPRVQWWEYDFRYRGELKGSMILDNDSLPMRVADIRRECVSFLAFDSIRLGEKIILEVPFGEKSFRIIGILQTAREDIPGRPIRYGLKVDTSEKSNSLKYTELKKVWDLKKKANIRRKFSDYVESREVSENK